MTNTFWHFGDSWSCTHENEIVFSKYIANHFAIEHVHCGMKGASNRQIFEKILEESTSFQEHDKILVNWSYFFRFDIHEERKGSNYTKSLFTKGNTLNINDLTSYERWWLHGIGEYAIREQFKLFKLIYHYFNYLETIHNITIYNSFILDYDLFNKLPMIPSYTLFFDSERFEETIDKKPLNGHEYQVTKKNKWYDDRNIEGVHYKDGIQEQLGELYIQEINRITNNNSSKDIL